MRPSLRCYLPALLLLSASTSGAEAQRFDVVLGAVFPETRNEGHISVSATDRGVVIAPWSAPDPSCDQPPRFRYEYSPDGRTVSVAGGWQTCQWAPSLAVSPALARQLADSVERLATLRLRRERDRADSASTHLIAPDHTFAARYTRIISPASASRSSVHRLEFGAGIVLRFTFERRTPDPSPMLHFVQLLRAAADTIEARGRSAASP